MVERGGRVVARVVADVKEKTILRIMAERILPKSTVFSDCYTTYDNVAGMRQGYEHQRINHSAKVYVMGDVHTNTIEGFWSLLKRGIGGVYHAVSEKYLQTYCDEYAFRYNRRTAGEPMFCFSSISGRGEGGIAFLTILVNISRLTGCISVLANVWGSGVRNFRFPFCFSSSVNFVDRLI